MACLCMHGMLLPGSAEGLWCEGHLRCDRHPNTKPVLYLLRICGVFVVYLGWVEKYMYLFCISCVFAKYFKMVKYMGTATSGTLPRHPYF